jgi:hypothetical protein
MRTQCIVSICYQRTYYCLREEDALLREVPTGGGEGEKVEEREEEEEERDEGGEEEDEAEEEDSAAAAARNARRRACVCSNISIICFSSSVFLRCRRRVAVRAGDDCASPGSDWTRRLRFFF